MHQAITMPMLHHLLPILLHRATYLTPIILAGLLIGEPWGRLLRFPVVRAQLAGIVASLGDKLNRPNRSIATRLYRGIVALAMLLLPAIALGFFLMRPPEWIQLLASLLLPALIGTLLLPYTAYRLHRAARRGTLALQSTDPHYLFADTYGQLRYHILAYGRRFALLTGASFYFLVADMPGLLAYLTLAAAAAFYSPAQPENRAFGWCAAGLFALFDAPPRLITCLLLWLAALFIPRTHPLTTLAHLASAARQFHGWLAWLLGLSLGGPVPTPAGEVSLPWRGDGTPKPAPKDFGRLLQLLLAALAILLMLLESSIYQ